MPGIQMTRIYVGADSGEIWGTEFRKVVLTQEHLSEDGDGIEGIKLSDDMSVGDTVWIIGEDWTAAGLVRIDVTQRELDEIEMDRRLLLILGSDIKGVQFEVLIAALILRLSH